MWGREGFGQLGDRVKESGGGTTGIRELGKEAGARAEGRIRETLPEAEAKGAEQRKQSPGTFRGRDSQHAATSWR